MIAFNVSGDAQALRRSLSDFARKQLPFATSLALNAVARAAVAGERAAMQRQLSNPTPFTLRGISFLPARKENPTAVVTILPIQAAYLEPVIEGDLQVKPGTSQAIIAPKNIRLDSFGNIPRNLIAALKGRPDIFIGAVTFHNGQSIDGVWQRPPLVGSRGSQARLTGGRRPGWKLLIRFTDPIRVEAKYKWGDATAAAVEFFPAQLDLALRRAIETAR